MSNKAFWIHALFSWDLISGTDHLRIEIYR